MEEANKLAQELSDRKMELKAAMFNDKLASFIAFPSMGDASLGELAFAHIQLPFKKLDINSSDLKPVDIRVPYDFLLPLEHGQHIVAFKCNYQTDDDCTDDTQISSFDRLGRLVGSANLEVHVYQGHAAQCGPNEFVVFHNLDLPELSVYDSALKRLRSASCKDFSSICCNSKFVFGLWDTGDSGESDSDDDDEAGDEQKEEEEEYSTHRIQARHLDTLRKAFDLPVPKKYRIYQIVADEHHVVAVSRLAGFTHWFMSVFDLQATCNESGRVARGRKLFLAERHVRLDIESFSASEMFLFDGWLVVPLENELVWFDKRGARSETSTEWDSETDIYSCGSSLLIVLHDDKLLLKR